MKWFAYAVVTCVVTVLMSGCATNGSSAEEYSPNNTSVQYGHHKSAATVAATMISPLR